MNKQGRHRRLSRVFTVVCAATISFLLAASAASAQEPEDALVDGQTVAICSNAFQSLRVAPDGRVTTGPSGGPDAQWLVSRDGDSVQLQNLSTNTWLNNAQDPVVGVDLLGDAGPATTRWEVASVSPEVLLENSAVSVVNELLRIGTESQVNTVTVGGTGLENGVGGYSQGSAWRVLPADGDAKCSDGTNATISDKTVDVSVGQAVAFQLTDGRNAAFNVQLELVSGTVPDGLRLGQGFLRGVPTTPGTSTFQYRLALEGRTEVATATVTVGDGATTTTTSDDAVTIPVGIRTEVDLLANDTIVGGIDGNNGVTVVSGQVPPGMFLAFNGVVAGRPNQAGTFSFDYQISSVDGSGAIGSAVVTVADGTPTEAVDDEFQIRQGERVFQGVFYNGDTVSAALARVELLSGALPSGVSLNDQGDLGGTPTESGQFAITYRLVSTSGSSDVGNATIIVAAAEGQTVANDDYYEVEIGTTLTIEPLANDTVSAGVQSVEIIDGEVPGLPSQISSGNRLVGQPVEAGEFELTYRLTSTSGSTDTGTITVVVQDADPVVLEDSLFYDDGTPATGVSIALVRRTGNFRGQRTFATTTVGADGTFRFDLIRGSYNLYYELLDDAVYVDANGQFANPRLANIGYDRFFNALPGDVIEPIRLQLARTTASMGGRLVDTDGADISFATIDFSSPTDDGRRWQRGIRVADDGSFSIDMPPGQWIVTAAIYTANGPRYIERRITLADGQSLEGVEVSLRDGVIRLPSDEEEPSVPNKGVVSGTVTDGEGKGVAGLVFDRFSAAADGSRQQWLGDETTNEDGSFGAEVDPGCYVLVFIAPTGSTFEHESRYAERGICVESGQEITVDVALSSTAAEGAAIAGSVSYQSGKPAAGVVIDRFIAGADGTRAAWVGDTETSDDGGYRFDVEPGCGVLVFIAPSGQSFTNGFRYLEQPVCVDAGKTVSNVDAVLRG